MRCTPGIRRPSLGEALREPALRDRRQAARARRLRQSSRQHPAAAAARVLRRTVPDPIFKGICSSATIANPRELAEGAASWSKTARHAARSSSCSSIRRSSTRSLASGARIWPPRRRRAGVPAAERPPAHRSHLAVEVQRDVSEGRLSRPARRGRRHPRLSRLVGRPPDGRCARWCCDQRVELGIDGRAGYR